MFSFPNALRGVGVSLLFLLMMSCEKDSMADVIPDQQQAVSPEAQLAGNNCERQNYHAHGTALTLTHKVCANDPNMAKAKVTLQVVGQAVLKRFNIDDSLCTPHDCNNTTKECHLGKPGGTVKVVSIMCVPSGHNEQCEAPEMEFDCTIVLSQYNVNAKCACEATQ